MQNTVIFVGRLLRLLTFSSLMKSTCAAGGVPLSSAWQVGADEQEKPPPANYRTDGPTLKKGRSASAKQAEEVAGTAEMWNIQ